MNREKDSEIPYKEKKKNEERWKKEKMGCGIAINR